jgi:hypothetical protein
MRISYVLLSLGAATFIFSAAAVNAQVKAPEVKAPEVKVDAAKAKKDAATVSTNVVKKAEDLKKEAVKK